MALRAELTDRLVAELMSRVPDLVAIYLFGSCARGDTNGSSDLDLAVLPRRRLDPVRRWDIQQHLAQLAGTDVDLVDLLASSTVLRVQVMADGRLLYEADRTERESFEATTLSAYARLNEERRGILADIAAAGRIHG
jgi:predicted nucleotidyltransferase